MAIAADMNDEELIKHCLQLRSNASYHEGIAGKNYLTSYRYWKELADRGMSKAEIARQMGVSRTHVSIMIKEASEREGK